MPIEIILKSHNPQQSDWSAPEPVVSQQQQIFDKPSKSNVRSNKVEPTNNSSSSKKQTRKK